MKKTISIFIISTLLVILFNSCKKYDEGPLISFRSKAKRLYGSWDISKAMVNDIDSTILFSSYTDATVNLINDEHSIYVVLSDNKINPKPQQYLTGIWIWESNKNNINFRFDNPTDNELNRLYFGPLQAGMDYSWEIKRLTNNEFFIETIYQNDNYRIELINRDN